MKRPKKVHVNGFDWSITYKTWKEWKRGGHDRQCSGETYAASHEIFILVARINENQVREVLQHEIMHACLAASGGTYVFRFIDLENAEETAIGTLSPTFLAVIRNNPKVRRYLYDG